MRFVLALGFLLSILVSPLSAQDSEQGPDASSSLSAQAFTAAMQNMHQNMMITYTGNTDQDFVRGMLPHHQGAIDMAKIELEYGSDPEIKRLAKQIIKAQTDEIQLMQNWMAHHGG